MMLAESETILFNFTYPKIPGKSPTCNLEIIRKKWGMATCLVINFTYKCSVHSFSDLTNLGMGA